MNVILLELFPSIPLINPYFISRFINFNKQKLVQHLKNQTVSFRFVTISACSSSRKIYKSREQTCAF